jgi:hypothetical protein
MKMTGCILKLAGEATADRDLQPKATGHQMVRITYSTDGRFRSSVIHDVTVLFAASDELTWLARLHGMTWTQN